jgi:UDP-N-acetylglucosamine 2-epimerase (non-hydrolysing)
LTPLRFSSQAALESRVLEKLSLSTKSYFVLTFHRAENVDDLGRFSAFLSAISRIAEEHPDRKIVFPVHPRVEKSRLEFGQEWPTQILPIAPLGYLDMLNLLSSADVIMTDSGGLQEEAAILGVPCVTMRDSTERPETVEAGFNIVAGLDTVAVSKAVHAMRGRILTPTLAYGDGMAAAKIIRIANASFGTRPQAVTAATL